MSIIKLNPDEIPDKFCNQIRYNQNTANTRNITEEQIRDILIEEVKYINVNSEIAGIASAATRIVKLINKS